MRATGFVSLPSRRLQSLKQCHGYTRLPVRRSDVDARESPWKSPFFSRSRSERVDAAQQPRLLHDGGDADAPLGR